MQTSTTPPPNGMQWLTFWCYYIGLGYNITFEHNPFSTLNFLLSWTEYLIHKQFINIMNGCQSSHRMSLKYSYTWNMGITLHKSGCWSKLFPEWHTKILQHQARQIKMKVQHAELFHFIKSPIMIHYLNLTEKFNTNLRMSINISQHCESVVQSELVLHGILVLLKKNSWEVPTESTVNFNKTETYCISIRNNSA